MLVIKQLIVHIDFLSISFPTMEINGDQKLFFKIFICIQHKKETYQGLEQQEDE